MQVFIEQLSHSTVIHTYFPQMTTADVDQRRPNVVEMAQLNGACNNESGNESGYT